MVVLRQRRRRYFYPRSPCGERPPPAGRARIDRPISIHALLAESDAARINTGTHRQNFYPRSPCGERPFAGYKSFVTSAFLSTLSLRRATKSYTTTCAMTKDFYPRSPCGERRLYVEEDKIRTTFLSTLSLRRATTAPRALQRCLPEFLSTLSLRRATCRICTLTTGAVYFYPRSPCGERPGGVLQLVKQQAISIHALLAESDHYSMGRYAQSFNFYPRSPCGERRSNQPVTMRTWRFLSTLSLRRATVHYDNYNLHCVISIHALLAESDKADSVSKWTAT